MPLPAPFKLGALLIVLGGCAGPVQNAVPVAAAPRPAAVEEISPLSKELVAFYSEVEAGQRARGLLRIDGGGPDVPYDADRLAATFTAVAFAREFSDQGDALVRREGESILHRWSQPVQIEPIFGPSVNEMQRADDRATLGRLAKRLERATRHPVGLVERGGNFRVLVVSEEERRAIGPTLQRLMPEIRQREIDVIEGLDPANYCVVVASDPGDDGVLTRAVAVIRAELPPRLRMSCFHEEIAQGLGLSNDSARARPSIFNDDDEFGRLTSMDEDMLRMLYDRRLKPGMSAAQAAPSVREIAATQTGSLF
ncbi:MAG: DUF2927 domain-containing protein [Pseudomonadota bacterium]